MSYYPIDCLEAIKIADRIEQRAEQLKAEADAMHELETPYDAHHCANKYLASELLHGVAGVAKILAATLAKTL